MEYKDATDVVAELHGFLDKLESKIRRSSVHRIFWHGVRIKWFTPPVYTAKTFEIEEPFRRARVVMVRYWWNRGLVLGFWGKTEYDEETNLLEATVYGRKRRDDERSAYDESKGYENSQGSSGELLARGSGLRVRATSDARADGQ